MSLAKSSLLTLVFVALLTMAFAVTGAQAQKTNLPEGVNVGIFNLQSAINDSQKGKAAKTKLAAKYDKLEKELKAKEAELDKMSKDLKTQAPTLSKEAIAQKEAALGEQIKAFQSKVQSYTEDMQKAENESLKPLFDEALKIAEQIGKDKGFVMVIESQKAGVIYALDGMDITPDVIKALDAKK